MVSFQAALISILAASAVAGPVPGRPAGPKSRGFSSLYADSRAHRVGDLLTVLILENVRAQQRAETRMQRRTNTRGRYLAELGGLPVERAMRAEGNEDHRGGGSTLRSNFFTARITVSVKEVLPNGMLRVEGSQQVMVNRERQSISLKGLVRPQDISIDNVVRSPAIAEADIQYRGKGLLSRKQRRGVISTLFGWIW